MKKLVMPYCKSFIVGLILFGSIACGGENKIIEPTIVSGTQSIIMCQDNMIYIDGVAEGTSVEVQWTSPALGQPDMIKTLYCLDTQVVASK